MTGTSRFVMSADDLVARLEEPGIAILDGSWYLPAQNRNARAEYDAAHIPGAVFFDHESVVDPAAELPHTLPSPSDFERHASSMGVTRDDTIVIYDGPGFFSAPRVWWMFRTMGADKVFVLDGGFDRWRAEGRPVTSDVTKIAPSAFLPDVRRERIANLDDMLATVANHTASIADARPAGRFEGRDPEPRPGLRGGHMPGAVNVPWSSLSEGGRLKPLPELRRILEDAGVDFRMPVVTTCGSGVSAAVIALALESLGHPDVRLYDGSWAEWGGRSDTPVVTGPATSR